jgi:peptidyl-prolyl cis-trans isomerase C
MKKAVAATSLYLLPLVCSAVILLVLSSSGCQKKGPTGKNVTPPPAGKAPETRPPARTPEVNTPSASKAPEVAPPAPAPTGTVTQAQSDKVLVTVNGTPITEGQVQRRIKAEYGPQLAKLAMQSPETAAQQEKMLMQPITQKMMVEQLLDEEAKAANITMTEEDIIAGMTQQLAAQKTPMTLDQFKSIVAAQGGDFQAIKESAARGMKYNKLFESKWTDSIAVTPEEAQKYYGEHPKEFETPEQVRASHILIATKSSDPNTDPNKVKVQAKEKAATLLKQVKDGGDFAALAKENSSCPSAAQGGDLGLFPRGQMVKPFEDVAFALKPGEVSDVVETQFGYHIIKVTEHRDPNTVSFENARSGIVSKLTQQKKNEFVRKYIDGLRAKAKIVTAAGSTPQPSQPAVVTPSDPNKK